MVERNQTVFAVNNDVAERIRVYCKKNNVSYSKFVTEAMRDVMDGLEK